MYCVIYLKNCWYCIIAKYDLTGQTDLEKWLKHSTPLPLAPWPQKLYTCQL